MIDITQRRRRSIGSEHLCVGVCGSSRCMPAKEGGRGWEGQASTLLDIGPSKVTNTLQSSSNNSRFGVSGVCRAPPLPPLAFIVGLLHYQFA